jgi:hypothetical protein
MRKLNLFLLFRFSGLLERWEIFYLLEYTMIRSSGSSLRDQLTLHFIFLLPGFVFAFPGIYFAACRLYYVLYTNMKKKKESILLRALENSLPLVLF